MKNKINRANLKAGRIEMVGWPDGGDSYSVWDYFDRDGSYLGPDEFGIEPIFRDGDAEYRYEPGHLYELQDDAYVHCYACHPSLSMQQAIDAYESSL
jgi:hypothetical protein